MATVRAETLNIDASSLNSGKVFTRVASKSVYSQALQQIALTSSDVALQHEQYTSYDIDWVDTEHSY